MNHGRLINKLLAITLIISLTLGCNFLTGLGGNPDQEFIQELLIISPEEADRSEQDMFNLLREQNGARAAFGDQADAIFLQMDQARAAALQDLIDQAGNPTGNTPKVSPRYIKDYQLESKAKLLMMFLLSLEYLALPRDQNGNALPPKMEDGAPAGAAGTHYSMELKLVGSRMEVTGTITSLITEPFPYEESMGFSLSLEVCPDAQGNVPVQLSFQNAGGLRSGGGKQLGVESQVVGHVNDEGRLDSYEDKSIYHGASQPKNAGQGGGEDWGTTNNFFEFQLDTTQYTNPGIPSTSDGAYIRESSDNDREFTERAAHDLAYMKNVMVLLALQAAEERWTKGYCLEIKVSDISAKGEMVSPNSNTPFTATVRHKFEGTDLTVPVIATLSAGQVSVNPSGSKVPAPAQFTYKAPDKSDQKATVHLETRSKRGIAELDVKFTTNQQAYELEFDSTFVTNTFTPWGTSGPINVTQHVHTVVPLEWSEKDQAYTGQAVLDYVLFDVPPIFGIGGDGGYFVPCPNNTSATGGTFRVLQLKGSMDTTTSQPGQTPVSSLEITIDPGTTVESIVPVCPPPATVPPGFSFPLPTWSQNFTSAHNRETQVGTAPYIIKDWVAGSEGIVAVKSYTDTNSAMGISTTTENTTITLVQK